MIRKRTVLILGAGASTHLGYPIGSTLRDEVCERALQGHVDAKIRAVYEPAQIGEFGRRLARGAFGSVDAFLEENREFLRLGRLLMADPLKRRENFERPFPPNKPDWYEYLFNCLAGETPDELPQNELTVVTFNYDRSLEYYLHQSIIYRYNIDETTALDLLSSIPIIHLHGILGEYPKFPYSDSNRTKVLEEIASQIKVVHEIDDTGDGFCSDEFKAAHDALVQSENIFFLGFGFNEDNVRRLNFFTPESTDKRNVLAATSYLYPLQRKELGKKFAKYGLTETVFTGKSCSVFFKASARLD